MSNALNTLLTRLFGAPERAPADVRAFVDAAVREGDEATTEVTHLSAALAESRRVESELDAAVSLLSATLESTTDGILVVDRAGRTVQMNRRFIELWQMSDAVAGARDDDLALDFVLDPLTDPEQFVRKMKALHDTPEATSFDELVFRDGRIFERSSQPQRIGGEVVGRVWSFRDITERRRLEEQLRQAQRMEAIGALAGGIAHDFNNLLVVIRGHAAFLQEALHDRETEREDAEAILASAARAATLVQQLLAFSRRQSIERVALDLNAVIAALTPMLDRLIGEHVDLTVSANDGLRMVDADAGQMEQLIVNLVVNARDAMPKGGRIAIETRNVTVDPHCTFGVASASHDAEFVLLTVSDSGEGIPVAIRHQVFEPFFTTKGPQRGTGLGLSTVFGIVSQVGGHVRFESEVGEGTTFQVYLPRSAHDRPTPPGDLPAIVDVGGTEMVLVVEDEAAVLGVVRRVLEKHGYRVLAATDSAEALRLAVLHGDELQLLVTDMVMPGLGGAALAKRVVQLCPSVRVLFVSGYSPDPVDHGLGHFLGKPFSEEQLARAVRVALDGSRSRSAS